MVLCEEIIFITQLKCMEHLSKSLLGEASI